MRSASLVVIAALLLACTGGLDQAAPTCTDDSGPNISVTKVSSNDGIAEYELRSNEDCVLTYFHWLAQGPDPVPYCKSDAGNVWICSTEVFGMQDANGSFIELTHETRLRPRATVLFHVREEGASELGIAFWSDAKRKEVYVWRVIGK